MVFEAFARFNTPATDAYQFFREDRYNRIEGRKAERQKDRKRDTCYFCAKDYAVDAFAERQHPRHSLSVTPVDGDGVQERQRR